MEFFCVCENRRRSGLDTSCRIIGEFNGSRLLKRINLEVAWKFYGFRFGKMCNFALRVWAMKTHRPFHTEKEQTIIFDVFLRIYSPNDMKMNSGTPPGRYNLVVREKNIIKLTLKWSMYCLMNVSCWSFLVICNIFKSIFFFWFYNIKFSAINWYQKQNSDITT